jgi:predicted TIM-barrel fold metal-dependent hydrolase
MATETIIDVHTHFAIGFGERFDLKGIKAGLYPWSEASAIKTMDENGITAQILSNPFVLTGSEALKRYRAQNEEYARIARDNPKRLGVFASLPLVNIDDALKEVAYALDILKMDGVCLPTSLDGKWLGHEHFQPLWAELDRRKAVVFVHPVHPINFDQTGMDYPVAVMEFMFESTRMITNMVYSGTKRRFPNAKVISTHGGGTVPYLARRIGMLAEFLGIGGGKFAAPEEVRKDLQTFYFDLTACTTPNALPAILDLVPSSQLMIGFDWPMMPPTLIKPAQDFVRTTKLLTDADRKAIFSGTALSLFPNLAARLTGG